jgi:hypothetical protein
LRKYFFEFLLPRWWRRSRSSTSSGGPSGNSPKYPSDGSSVKSRLSIICCIMSSAYWRSSCSTSSGTEAEPGSIFTSIAPVASAMIVFMSVFWNA